jgi:CD109 antigen
MDKAVYKPADIVQFRVLAVDGQTKPIRIDNMHVFVTDAADNRVKQFEPPTTFRHGVFKQQLQLSDQPVLGTWKVHVKITADADETVKEFEVAEYVLPTFEVRLVARENWRKDEEIVVAYSAIYTYGQPVEGEATLTAQVMNDWWWEPSPLRTLVKILNGTTTTINPREDLNLQDINYMRSVKVTVTFREGLTGRVANGTMILTIHEVPFTIEMTGSDDQVKPQIPFKITAMVKDVNQVPVTDAKNVIRFNVTLTLDEIDPNQIETTTSMSSNFWWRPPRTHKQTHQTFTRFLKDGLADFTLVVTSNVTSISVESTYMTANGYFSSYLSPTASNEYIEAVAVGPLTLSRPTFIECVSNAKMKHLNYLVLGMNRVLASARLNVGGAKKFRFFFWPTVDMLPVSRIVLFYLTGDGEIISDRVELNYGSELRNFVSIFVGFWWGLNLGMV